MLSEPAAQQNRSTLLENEVDREINPSTSWRVKHVQPLKGFRLQVVFADGLSGVIEMSNLVHAPNAGVFAPLADPAKFAQVSIEYGAVVWPGGLDLAPDAMYQAIKQDGKWTL